MHDLVISKHVANRPKDHSFIAAATRAGFLDARTLRERLAVTPLDDAARAAIAARIERDAGGGA